MSHIGRIAAGTLAKRGRRGGSSVSSLISFGGLLLVVGSSTLSAYRNPWKFARARRQLAAPKTAGVVLQKEVEGTDRRREPKRMKTKDEEKRESNKMRMKNERVE